MPSLESMRAPHSFVRYTPRFMKRQAKVRNKQKSLAPLNGVNKEANCGSATVPSPNGKQEVDTPIAISEKDVDVDMPPLQHAICQSELGGRDIGPLRRHEQSAMDVDVPPGSPGQNPRRS